ncbi:MAG TPA: helix-turn-helix transcriptional regulator [Symbiobacteriaceae bacterium]|jgi:transcriptional regulator with XRE-family HTH domain
MSHRFGDRLKELRAERKLLQRDLEKVLNLRPGAASQYERALREPGFDLLLAVADYFDVSVDYLLGRPEATRESPALAAARRRLRERLNAGQEGAGWDGAAPGLDGLPWVAAGPAVDRLLTLAAEAAPDVFATPRLARRLSVPEQSLRLARRGELRLPPEVWLGLQEYLGLCEGPMLHPASAG